MARSRETVAISILLHFRDISQNINIAKKKKKLSFLKSKGCNIAFLFLLDGQFSMLKHRFNPGFINIPRLATVCQTKKQTQILIFKVQR